VHRVKGLEKGLYFLVRNEEHLDSLKKAMKSGFEWVQPFKLLNSRYGREVQEVWCSMEYPRLSIYIYI
jgi:hypothetical protein